MQLDEVRALKAQWRAQHEARAYAEAPTRLDEALPWVALGVAPGARPGDYCVAVRLPAPSAQAHALLARWAEEARGEVDVRYLGTVRPASAVRAWVQAVRRPLAIGVSVSHVRGPAGTLGAFMRRRMQPAALFALSSGHVLARCGLARPGEAVLQPAAADGGELPDTVGSLGWSPPLLLLEANTADAALAELDAPAWPAAPGEIHMLGRLASPLPHRPAPGATVHKLGRTTGLTSGRITALELDELPVQYPVGLLRFDASIEVEGTDDTPCFAAAGDSGALVVDAGLHGVGLLFGASTHGSAYRGPAGQSLAYLHPLEAVLSAVDATLAT